MGYTSEWALHNLLMQVFTLGNSKMQVFETHFFDTVITKNDHPRYVKHVLAVFTLFGYWARGGGGGSNENGTQPAYAHFHPGQLKIEVFETHFFDTVIT